MPSGVVTLCQDKYFRCLATFCGIQGATLSTVNSMAISNLQWMVFCIWWWVWLSASHSYMILKFHSSGLSMVSLGYPTNIHCYIHRHKLPTNVSPYKIRKYLKTYKHSHRTTILLSVMSPLKIAIILSEVFLHETSQFRVRIKVRKRSDLTNRIDFFL